MTYEQARHVLRDGKRVSRESWVDGFYIEATNPDPNVRMRFTDNCGRDYQIDGGDITATDWVMVEE